MNKITILLIISILLIIFFSFFVNVLYTTVNTHDYFMPDNVPLTDIRLLSPNNTTTFTAYSLSVDETDDTPCIGAGNNNLCELRPILRENCQIICASRDLPLDTIVYIDGFGECVIKDRMNKRYAGTGRIDILMDTKQEALNFGIRTLNYVIVKQ